MTMATRKQVEDALTAADIGYAITGSDRVVAYEDYEDVRSATIEIDGLDYVASAGGVEVIAD
jgi:hypothetical protein